VIEMREGKWLNETIYSSCDINSAGNDLQCYLIDQTSFSMTPIISINPLSRGRPAPRIQQHCFPALWIFVNKVSIRQTGHTDLPKEISVHRRKSKNTDYL
jgi:hypothetical protein